MKTIKQIEIEYENTLSDVQRTFRQAALQAKIEEELGETLEAELIWIRGNGGGQTKKFEEALKDGIPKYFGGSFFDEISNFSKAVRANWQSIDARYEEGIKVDVPDSKLVYIQEVFETINYSKFEPMNGQPLERADKNAKKLMEDIKPVGRNIMPIIVNKEYKVIDGNTRLEACKRLNVPVRYLVIGDTEGGQDVEVMKMMNASNKPWTQYNFVEFYAEAYDDKYYKDLKQFIQKNKFSIGIYSALEPKLGADIIRDGNVGEIDYNKLQIKVNQLSELNESVSIYMTSKLQMARALNKMINYTTNDKHFSFEKLIKKIKKYIQKVTSDLKINRINHADELLYIIQKCYNMNERSKVRIYNDL
jgi:hypothetical protein